MQNMHKVADCRSVPGVCLWCFVPGLRYLLILKLLVFTNLALGLTLKGF